MNSAQQLALTPDVDMRSGDWGIGLRKLVARVRGAGANGAMAEIGSFQGDGTGIFSPAFALVYAVDPWAGGYDDGDIASRFDMAAVEAEFDRRRRGWPNVRKFKATSEEAALSFADGLLDFVYIDGCHMYESVKRDIAVWLPKVRAGGFIGGHDFNMDGVRAAVAESLGDVESDFEDMSWIRAVSA